jgi:hypothetical protein
VLAADTKEIRLDIVEKLVARTSGHGAFGESESYKPSELHIEAAREIIKLRKLLAEKVVYEPAPYYLNPDFKMPPIT